MNFQNGEKNAAHCGIGIVGAGTMGQGIAQIAGAAGYPVVLFDAQPEKAVGTIKRIIGRLEERAKAGKTSADTVSTVTSNLSCANSLDELKHCSIVFEAIVEDLAAKRSLFASLEALVSDDCILATNTSSLLVTAIAAGCRQPSRVVGAHFFNPVPVMKIVEVIPGVHTACEVIEKVRQFVETFGHCPVVVSDSPGFLVNHAGRGLYTEGLRIVEEGITSPQQVDEVLREAAAFRMGPFQLFDLTGLDVSFEVLTEIYNGFYQEDRFRPTPLLRRQFEGGLYGRKTQRGFYSYGDDATATDRVDVPARWLAKEVWLSPAERSEHPWLVDRLSSMGIALDDGNSPRAGSIIAVLPLGDDTTTTAVNCGYDMKRVIGIDALIPNVEHFTLMPAIAADTTFRDSLHGMILAAGETATVIHDSPGFIVQRVLAMIINISSDIAQRRIAAPKDIDMAVRIGLGYPNGPLSLGDALGPRKVLRILDRMFAFYGDPRYRPSPWLKRRALADCSLMHEDA